MKTLIINGSPKGNKSNTKEITNAFVEGLKEQGNFDLDIINIQQSKINHCTGCFACWTKTPGKCVIADDMDGYIQKYIEADLVIWSMPLYFYGMPSKVKAFLDRFLPLNLPFIEQREDGGSGHPSRYNLPDKKYVLISSCGFASTENNYEALVKQFDIMFGDSYEKILCPEGELLRVPALSGKINEYLTIVKKAGKEFAESSKFKSGTQKELEELLFPPNVFADMANANWEIMGAQKEGNEDISYPFLKQMQAVFNPSNAKDIDTIIEFDFTDIHRSYQFIIKNQTCTLIQGSENTYVTKIETPFSLWQDISSGKADGMQAIMEGKYKVLGDINIMMQFDSLFGK